ncbi:UNKNOWN [Stylonychia lemnae]|uniref:Uncharacterized protein n=1 Tax=Stylonychia lemnae TaxID=5949 RepID=A0A078ART7_STYLE|nr:UNKNOWN [Stylonychia lemnae]|eukprot:CDW85200.1 UNKNOWN [Stylonychia lemnae]
MQNSAQKSKTYVKKVGLTLNSAIDRSNENYEKQAQQKVDNQGKEQLVNRMIELHRHNSSLLSPKQSRNTRGNVLKKLNYLTNDGRKDQHSHQDNIASNSRYDSKLMTPKSIGKSSTQISEYIMQLKSPTTTKGKQDFIEKNKTHLCEPKTLEFDKIQEVDLYRQQKTPNIHKNGGCQKSSANATFTDDKLSSFKSSIISQQASVNSVMYQTFDQNIKSPKQNSSNTLRVNLKDYMNFENDQKVDRIKKHNPNVRVLKKNNSAINIISDPFNITIDINNKGTLKFNKKTKDKPNNGKDFQKEYLQYGVWPEMSYQNQQEIRQKQRQTEREKSSEKPQIIINSLSKDKLAFEINDSHHLYQFRTQNLKSMEQNSNEKIETDCKFQQVQPKHCVSGSCICCQQLNIEKEDHNRTKKALDQALQLANLLMREIHLIDKKITSTVYSEDYGVSQQIIPLQDNTYSPTSINNNSQNHMVGHKESKKQLYQSIQDFIATQLLKSSFLDNEIKYNSTSSTYNQDDVANELENRPLQQSASKNRFKRENKLTKGDEKQTL